MQSYMELIYIDSEDLARKTNMQRAGATNADTWAEFNSYRRYAVDYKDARFLLDYHNANGDLADTIPIDAGGFIAITGQQPKSERDYCEIDSEYWSEIAKTPAAA